MLKYLGLIEAPWDKSQKFHAFEEELPQSENQREKRSDIYYYSEVTGNLLWVKKAYGSNPRVYEYRRGLEEKQFTDEDFKIDC